MTLLRGAVAFFLTGALSLTATVDSGASEKAEVFAYRHSSSVYKADLAPEIQLSENYFREKFAAKTVLLSHDAVNRVIRTQILQEQTILKEKWEDRRTEIREIADIRGNISLTVKGLDKVRIVRVANLMNRTGQFAHVGLSGGGQEDKLPVIYVDSGVYSKFGEDIIKHEADEILQWEHLRVNVLGLDKSGIRGWIKNHVNSPFNNTRNVLFRGRTSRDIAEDFHKRSFSMDDVYEAYSVGTQLDHKYISSLIQLYGVDKDSGDINISAADGRGISREVFLRAIRGDFAEVIGEQDGRLAEAHIEFIESLKQLGVFEDENWSEGRESFRTVQEPVNKFNEELIKRGYYVECFISMEESASDPSEPGPKMFSDTELFYYEVESMEQYMVGDTVQYVIEGKSIGETDNDFARRTAARHKWSNVILLNRGKLKKQAADFSLMANAEDKGGYKFLGQYILSLIEEGLTGKISVFRDTEFVDFLSITSSICVDIVKEEFRGMTADEIYNVLRQNSIWHELQHVVNEEEGMCSSDDFFEEIVMEERSAILAEFANSHKIKVRMIAIAEKIAKHLLFEDKDEYSVAIVEEMLPEMFPDIYFEYEQESLDEKEFIVRLLKEILEVSTDELRKSAEDAHMRIFFENTLSGVFLPDGEWLYPEGPGFRPIGDIYARLNSMYYEHRGGDIYEDFQTSVSRDDIIAQADAKEFYATLLENRTKLSDAKTIYIHYWAAGDGRNIADFLDHFKKLDRAGDYYPRLHCVVGDFSRSILEAAKQNRQLMEHEDILSFVRLDATVDLPFRDKKAMLIRFNELYDDLGGVEKIEKTDHNTFYRMAGRLRVPVGSKFMKKDGTTVTAREFVEDYWGKGMEALKELSAYSLYQIDYEEKKEGKPVDLEKHPFGAFMREWTKGVDKGIFTVNIDAAENLRRAIGLLDKENGGYIRVSDYGFLSKDVITYALEKPAVMAGMTGFGQPTARVNFPLLKWVADKELGVSTKIENDYEYVKTFLEKEVRSQQFLFQAVQETGLTPGMMTAINMSISGVEANMIEKRQLLLDIAENRYGFSNGQDNREIKEAVEKMFKKESLELELQDNYHLKVQGDAKGAERERTDMELEGIFDGTYDARKDVLTPRSSAGDAPEKTKQLLNLLLPMELDSDRVYEIRYDADRLRDYAVKTGLSQEDSPVGVLKEYVTLLKLRSKLPENIVLRESSAKGMGLLSVMCYRDSTKKELIGTGSVDMEGDLAGHLLKIVDMLNMALAVANVPEEENIEDITAYRGLIDFVREGYLRITGESPDEEDLVKIQMMRHIVFPRTRAFPLEQLSSHYRNEILAIQRAA